MNRLIKGQIHKVSNDFKIISIQIVNKLEFFYLQPRFVKQFRKYLYPGVFVQVIAEDDKFKLKRRSVSKILSFEKIIGNRYHRKFSYFDQHMVKAKIIDKIKMYKYRLFLDLEMTIQRSKQETMEIIQAGAILVDQNDKVILNFSRYIKPTRITSISPKTLNFLNTTEDRIFKGVKYHEFYKFFLDIVNKYHPAVIVWGNNDKYALDVSYELNKVEPIFNDDDFINLQQVHKEYYNVNYELGLFNTSKIYNIKSGEQEHNAFIDAHITQLIFNRFYEIASNNLDFDFKTEMLKYNFYRGEML